MTFTKLAAASSDPPEPVTDRLRLAVAAYLALLHGLLPRAHRIRAALLPGWCAERGLDPLAARAACTSGAFSPLIGRQGRDSGTVLYLAAGAVALYPCRGLADGSRGARARPPERAGPAAGSAAPSRRDEDHRRGMNQFRARRRCPVAAPAAGPGRQMRNGEQSRWCSGPGTRAGMRGRDD
jgi:hypothetical protein